MCWQDKHGECVGIMGQDGQVADMCFFFGSWVKWLGFFGNWMAGLVSNCGLSAVGKK